MQIVYTSGCANNWLGINGVREIDMTEQQRKEFLDKIINKLSEVDPNWFNNFIKWVSKEYGNKSCLEGSYDCCGDTIVIYTFEL